MGSIAFVVPRVYGLFSPQTGVAFGGAEKQIYLFACGLAKRGYTVSCIVGDFGQSPREIHEDVSLIRSFALSDNPIRKIIRLISSIRETHADVFVFRSAHSGILLGVLLVKYLFGKHAVYMVAHDMEADSRELAKHAGRLTAWAMGWVYRLVDGITFQTEWQCGEFAQKYSRHGTVVPNIYESTEKTLGKQEKKNIVWVGRAEPWKRPEVFFRLARAFPDTYFCMILSRVEGRETYYETLLRDARDLPNLFLRETRDRTEVMDTYTRACVYVLSSESEGFSNTMMEAMDSQCVILSLGIDPDSIITRYHLGIVCDNSENRLRESLASLLASPEMCRIFGYNARTYILTRHSSEFLLPVFESFLSSVCQKNQK